MENVLSETRVGLKRIGFRALTGEVVKQERGTALRLADGREAPLRGELVDRLNFKLGDRLSVLWCVRWGDQQSPWVAGLNHTGGDFGVWTLGLNQVIAPPAYTLMSIIAIFAGLFAAFALFQGSPGAVVVLALSIGFFVLFRLRQRKVVRAIRGVLENLGRQAAESAPAAAPSLRF